MTAWLAYRWLSGTWCVMIGVLAGIAVVTVDPDKIAAVAPAEPRE